MLSPTGMAACVLNTTIPTCRCNRSSIGGGAQKARRGRWHRSRRAAGAHSGRQLVCAHRQVVVLQPSYHAAACGRAAGAARLHPAPQ